MSATGAGAPFGVSPFWIRHSIPRLLSSMNSIDLELDSAGSVIQLATNIFQRGPAGILDRFSAVTRLGIQILAAVWTEPLAVIAANRLEGKRQQHLLLQNVFQLQSLALIVADLGLCGGDGKLLASCIGPLRAIQQIKIMRHVLYHWLETARTSHLNFGLQAAVEAYVFYNLMLPVLLFDQLSAPGGLKHFYLAEILTQVKHTWADVLFEINRMQLKFVDFDEHQAPPALPIRTAKPAEARSEEQVLQEVF
jgi:hypothetical protein